MKYLKQENTVILRLEKGEEIISSLTALTKALSVKCGRVSGIGAVNEITIGVFSESSKVYTKKNINADMEILSLSGNLSRMNGAPYVHIHGTFASLDGVFGGHVNEARVSATAEIIIDLYDIKVERKFSEEIGLNLFEI